MLAHPLRRACSSGPQVNGVHRRTEDSIWLELRGDHLADTTSPQSNGTTLPSTLDQVHKAAGSESGILPGASAGVGPKPLLRTGTSIANRMYAHCTHQALSGAGRVHLRQVRQRAPCSMQRRSAARAPYCAAAQQKRKEQETASQQTVGEPLRAPGSASSFVGLPADPKDIKVTTPVSDRQMQASALRLGVCTLCSLYPCVCYCPASTHI